MKVCPYCAEEIQDAAIVCKHCRRDLPSATPSLSPFEQAQQVAATQIADVAPAIPLRATQRENRRRVLRAAEGRQLRAGYAVLLFCAMASFAWAPSENVVSVLLLAGTVAAYFCLGGMVIPRIISAGVIAFLFFVPALGRLGAARPHPAPTAEAEPRPGPVKTVTGATRPEGYVSREDLGDLSWPLTVDAGVLSCEREAIVFTANGIPYGVNGLAKGRGYRRIEDIWKWREGIAARMDLSALFERGQRLC